MGVAGRWGWVEGGSGRVVWDGEKEKEGGEVTERGKRATKRTRERYGYGYG